MSSSYQSFNYVQLLKLAQSVAVATPVLLVLSSWGTIRDAFIKRNLCFLLLFHTFPFRDSLVSDPLNPISERQTGEREAKIPKSQLSEAQNFVLL